MAHAPAWLINTLIYLGAMVVIPLAACFAKASTLSLDEFAKAVWSPRALAAYLRELFATIRRLPN